MTMQKIFFFVLVLFSPIYALAFGIDAPNSANPSDNVTAKLLVSPQDPYVEEIYWFVNDDPVQKDKNTISFSIPDADYVEVKVIIKDSNNETYTLSKRINVSKLNVIWEAQTYTPFFYDGAPLPSYGSYINAQALFKTDSPEKYIYSWKLDGNTLSSVSGVGKYNIKTRLGYLQNSSNLSVSVLDPDNSNILAQKSVLIQYYKPKMYMYAKDELLGWRFGKYVKDFLDLSYPKEVLVIPYFTDIENLFDPKVTWSWFVDNVALPQEQISSPYVRLRFEDPSKNRAELKVKAGLQNNVFQNSELNLVLINNDKTDPSFQEGSSDAPNTGFGI